MVDINMSKSIKVDKKKRGRPATGRAPLVSARIHQEIVDRVDAWAETESITRSSAIARLVELGLTVKSPTGRK